MQDKIESFSRSEPAVAGLPELKSELINRRDLAAESAKAALTSARYRLLVLDILEWIEDGKWLKKPDSCVDQEARLFAAQLFERRTKRTKKKAKKVGEVDARKRHKLRIAIKKLRYALNFFESLFGRNRSAKRLSRYKDCLKNLQDNLGALNDIAVHQRLARDLAGENGRKRALTVGVVAGREQCRIAQRPWIGRFAWPGHDHMGALHAPRVQPEIVAARHPERERVVVARAGGALLSHQARRAQHAHRRPRPWQ